MSARMRPIVGAALVVAAVAAVDASGSGAAGTAWNGTLTYAVVQPPAFQRVSNLRLRVTYDGRVVYNRKVALPRQCLPNGCELARPPFELVDLGSARGPTALIWLWTGGAHCCSILRVVSIPDGRSASKNFGDPGARLAISHGVRVFVSADDRFAYLFTSFASSGLPVRIWRFRDGRFSDVTRLSPERITADAARWWKVAQRARRTHGEARGAFAAWAADTCALGRAAAVRRELALAVAAHVFSPPRGESGGPTGARYAAALRAKLSAWHYCR